MCPMMKREMASRLERRAPSSALNFLLLFRDDLVFDLIVGGLGNDLFSYQVGLLRIGTAVDDFLGVAGSDARQSFQLFFGRRVDVEQIGMGSRGCGGLGWLLGGLRLSHPANQA